MKILVILPRVPYPINKGDKLRAYQQIKLLSKQHEIYLYALSDEILDEGLLSEKLNFCRKISVYHLSYLRIAVNLLRTLFTSLPFQVSYFYSDDIKSRLDREIESIKPDLIFCQLIRTGEYFDKRHKIPAVLDYIDVLSKGLERRLESANIFLKPLIYMEYKRVAEYEKKVFDKFDEKIIITENDRDLLPYENNDEVKVIPNGIDTEYFRPIHAEKEYDLIFTGNLSYPPNVNAAVVLVEKILPILLTRLKNIKILLVGASPAAKVRKLASSNVEIKGWVDDIRQYYARAKIFVAPMQIGTGMQNKLLEAMAMNLPCVTSSLSQQGIQAPENTCLLVGDTPEDYAEHIFKLLNDKEYACSIAENGCRFVNENFNWSALSLKLEGLLNDIMQKSSNEEGQDNL